MQKNSDKKIDFAIGGQALIEGVMMRSPNFISIALREKKTKITYKNYPFQSLVKKVKWLNIPVFRGMINLVEMMVIGMKALNYSAGVYAELPEEEQKDTNPKVNSILTAIFGFLTLIFSLALALFLFKFLPLWITSFLSSQTDLIKNNSMLFNFIDGVIKMLFFLIYVVLISFIPDITRVFEYHGAEHKAVFTYEKGLELTPENAKKESRFHPRCGTSFILVVLMLSIFVYTFVPQSDVFMVKFFQRLALLPLIAGISYEVLKWSAKHRDKKWVKVLVAPGLLFQRLTTKEPNEKQLEIALAALKKALELEKG